MKTRRAVHAAGSGASDPSAGDHLFELHGQERARALLKEPCGLRANLVVTAPQKHQLPPCQPALPGVGDEVLEKATHGSQIGILRAECDKGLSVAVRIRRFQNSQVCG